MSQKKFYIGLKNEVSTNTLELYFTDYIYDGWDWNTWETINMVQETIDKIKAANPSKIKMIINSLGGDVMIGLAIFNYLKSSGISIEAEIIGFAASIASVMAMAGNPVRMARNSFMIIHQAWTYASGNAVDLRRQADQVEKVSNELADIYAQKSGKHDAKHFIDMWADGKDVWLTATEAKELGLVDEITNEVTVSASVDFNSYGFKNVPAALLNASAGGNTPQSLSNQIQEGFMKIMDRLSGIFNTAKDNKDTDKIAQKQEILDLVNSVLTPFAEAVDQALEEVKPKEEEKPTEEKPVEEKPTEDKPTAEKPVEEKPTEEVPVVENKGIADLKAMIEEQNKTIKSLQDSLANASMKPNSGKTDGNGKDFSNSVKIEYDK